MENGPFEDTFPIEHVQIPLLCQFIGGYISIHGRSSKLCVLFFFGVSLLSRNKHPPAWNRKRASSSKLKVTRCLVLQMGASSHNQKDGKNPMRTTLHFPFCPQQKPWESKKMTIPQTSELVLVFVLENKEVKGLYRVSFNFCHLESGVICLVTWVGEPPTRKPDFLVDPTRHAENAAALLENVLGTQGSGWYGSWLLFYVYD